MAPTVLIPDIIVALSPVIFPLAVMSPAKVETPPVTSKPSRAVINPTESILVTSSYVSVPPIDTFPKNVERPDTCKVSVSTWPVTLIPPSVVSNFRFCWQHSGFCGYAWWSWCF